MARLCSSRFERAARRLGWTRIAGLDEAGRGALFGPWWPRQLSSIRNGGSLGSTTPKNCCLERRCELSERIRSHAIAWAVPKSTHNASTPGISIKQPPGDAGGARTTNHPADYLLIDAMQLDVMIEQKSLIKGDRAASLSPPLPYSPRRNRDACMEKWDAVYPL